MVNLLISKASFALGGLLSGLSLFVEEKRRREELAMYVLPKGLESAWVMARGKGWVFPLGMYGSPLLTAIGMGMVMVRGSLCPSSVWLIAIRTSLACGLKSTYQVSLCILDHFPALTGSCRCRMTRNIYRDWCGGYCTSLLARIETLDYMHGYCIISTFIAILMAVVMDVYSLATQNLSVGLSVRTGSLFTVMT